jgi:hypothetical protein
LRHLLARTIQAVGACALLVSGGTATAQSPTAPLIFNYTLSSAPGDIIALQGANFGSASTVWLHAPDGTPLRPLEIVSRPNADAMNVRLPADAGAALRVAVNNAGAVSNIVPLNGALAYGLDATQIVPGGGVKVLGRNLLAAGFVPQVSIGGYPAQIDLAHSDAHMLSVTAPLALQSLGSGPVSITVDNGNGTGASTMDRQVKLLQVPAADPFGVNVGWTAVFASHMRNVIDFATNQYQSLNLPPIVCDGVTNASPAIKAALLYQSRQPGGGAVQLPPGHCLLEGPGSALQMYGNVVLQGAGATGSGGAGQTVLTYTNDYFSYSDGKNFALRHLTIEPGTGADVGLAFRGASNIVLQDIHFTHAPSPQKTGLAVNIEGGENLVVVGSTFVGTLRTTGINGFHETGNTVQSEGDGVTLDGNSQGLFTNNHLTRISTLTQRGSVVLHILTVNFTSRTLLAGNTFDVNGLPIDPYHNDGETILSESGGPAQTGHVGVVTSAEASSLTDTTRHLNFTAENPGSDPVANLSIPQNATVSIVRGVGAGQTRYITAYDAATHRISIDKPWDLPPTAGSHYATSLIGLEKIIIKQNQLIDNSHGILVYAGSREVDILDNTLNNNGGIEVRAVHYFQPQAQLFYPNYNVLVARNHVVNPVGGFPPSIHLLEAADGCDTWYGTGCDSFGIANIDVIFRDNEVTALGHAEGYASVTNGTVGLNHITSQTQPILGTIFQRNTCHLCDVAYLLDAGNFGAVLDAPMQDVGSVVLPTSGRGLGTVATGVPASLSLRTSDATIAAGQHLSLAAQVLGLSPTGTVQFLDGGSPLGSPVAVGSDGVARLSTQTLSASGWHALSASYSGDAANLPASTAVDVQVLVSAPDNASAANPAAPLILNHSLTVSPGDVLSLQGQNFGALPEVWLTGQGGTTRKLDIVNGALVATGVVAVRLPADAGYPMAVSVKNGALESARVALNQARAYHLDAVEIVPGGGFRVVGRNLLTPGFTPQVMVSGRPAVVDVPHSTDNMLMVTAPVGLAPTANAFITVDNGNGSGPSVLDRDITIRAIAPADPFGLGIGWTAAFAPFMRNVIDVTSDVRMLDDSRINPAGFARCDGVTDDRAAIQFAMFYMSGLGGGVVQLPAGNCRIAGALQMGGNVVLQGQGMGATTISYGNMPAYASGGTFAIRNLRFAPSGASTVTTGLNFRGQERIVLQNVDLGPETRGVYHAIEGGRNLVVSGSKLRGEILGTNSGFAWLNNELEVQYGSALYLIGAHDGVLIGNDIRRAMASNQLADGGRGINASGASRLSLFNNVVRAVAAPFDPLSTAAPPKMTGNWEALYATQWSRYGASHSGLVQTASAITLTDAANVLIDLPADSPTTLPDNYTVVIVSGKGAGQWRTIRAYDAAAHTITIDRAWAVVPDSSSRYATFVPEWEKVIIRGNTFSHFLGGVSLQNWGINEVDFIGNTLNNSQGLIVRSQQAIASQVFRPAYNVTISGNTLQSPDFSYQQGIKLEYFQASGPNIGSGFLGAALRDNRIMASRPAAHTSNELPEGIALRSALQASAAYSNSPIAGAILERNSCLNCSVLYTLGAGDWGTVVSAPLLSGTTQLISHARTTDDAAGVDQSTSYVQLPVGVVASVSMANPALGQALDLSASITVLPGNDPSFAATGSVQFMDSGRPLGSPVAVGANGSASLHWQDWSAGTHTITANYLGDAKNAAAVSPPSSVSVAQAQPTVHLSASPGAATAGQMVGLSVSISGYQVSGSVQLQVNGQNFGAPLALNNAQATLMTNALPAGSLQITAIYTGDQNNTANSSSALEITLQPAQATLFLSAVPQSVNVGQSLSLTASVSGSQPGGTVQLFDGGLALGSPAVLVNGNAMLQTPTLTAGTHQLTVIYSGDANNVATSVSLSVQVVDAAVVSNDADTPVAPGWMLLMAGAAMMRVVTAGSMRKRTTT